MQKNETVSTAEGLKRLEALDFSDVRRKLMEPPPEGQGWSEDCAKSAEKWYRRFLTLFLKYPGRKIVPNAMIDAFWHQNILDTRAYARDCQEVFGRFVHHYPYFGMNGDAAERDAAYAETNDMFDTEFGENPLHLGSKALECSTGCGWVDDAARGRAVAA